MSTVSETVELRAAWEACGDEAVVALSRLFAGADLVDARRAKLSFYEAHRLLEIRFTRGGGSEERAFALHDPGGTRWLDGTSAPIHTTNAAESLALTDDTVVDYVRFFFYFVRGDSGAFVLIESPDEIEAGAADGDLAAVRSLVTPLTTRGTDGDGRWRVGCTVAYDGTLFATTLAVASDGNVEMTEDEPLATVEEFSIPEYASLEQAPARAAGVSGDRDVTEAIVAVLLEDSMREREADTGSGNMLLRHFNAETGGEPIDRLERLVANSMPVIVIESDIPFVEDFVAGLIGLSESGSREVARAGLAMHVTGDELRCAVNFDDRSVKLHLLSFHAYSRLLDAERTAHELALGDAAVLIGCDRAEDVPEPLRRIADLVLRFPRIDRRRFERIFERVFGARPTPGWDAQAADWTRYLVPADFHAPRRLGLSSDDALQFLGGRVEARLRQVTPEPGKGLDDLHGIGEARQICEDLLADIRAAQAGEIPWSAVDRGLLLVGPPGTGKTSLARAVAKECGVKFIAASAARWQSSGALDAHLLAMRADFVEARRYAPSILFIDELDSIGNRERFSGQNMTYNTAVVDALLEQIQGFSTSDPVIVIGATNYVENVDPALRRAGRLDQVVELPLPNVEALKDIFASYLEPYRTADDLERDVDTRTLAELSLGLTGADVEFFVRGAARRARRARRKISQEDLAAEVTRRPRRPDSAPRLRKDELQRVAVHEAGHALAQLIGSRRGEGISYITVVPRLDGSLGFVASVPPDTHVATRRDLLERLETVLAGRAAEEVVFGADDVGTGAGGDSRSSDLAVATALAEHVVCRSGLGDDGALRWTESPTAAQDRQVDALLARAYSGIVARLQSHRELLDRVVDILVAKQELSGAELRELLRSEQTERALVR